MQLLTTLQKIFLRIVKPSEDEEERKRFRKYFRQLASLIPEPDPDWREKARPCKYDAILKERNAKKMYDNGGNTAPES